MTDYSLMIPTIIISFSIFLLALASINQYNKKSAPRSFKTSQVVSDDPYWFSTDIYDYQYPHSSGSDMSDHFGGDFGGGYCDGGSH